jgi:TonB-dependent starch-binding outer membrane protein SusC
MYVFTHNRSLLTGIWLLPLLMLLSRSVHSQGLQNNLIKGTVVAAETNEGIPGVNISIKNSTQGTTTKADGDFALSVPVRPSVVVISYIGYQTQEVTVNSQTTLAITLVLHPASKVVHTAYL